MTINRPRIIPDALAAEAKEVLAQLIRVLTIPFPVTEWAEAEASRPRLRPCPEWDEAQPNRLHPDNIRAWAEAETKSLKGMAFANVDCWNYLAGRISKDPINAITEMRRSIAVGLMMAQAQDFPFLHVHAIVGYTPILNALRDYLIGWKVIMDPWCIDFVDVVEMADQIFDELYTAADGY